MSIERAAHPEGIHRLDAAKLYWEEYKLRQTHYWSSFNKFMLAVITIDVIPFVRPEIRTQLGNLTYFFPGIAVAVSLACMWLLGAEYQRLQSVRRKYDDLLGPENQRGPLETEGTWNELTEKPIGRVTSLGFGLGLIALSVITGIALWQQAPAPAGG